MLNILKEAYKNTETKNENLLIGNYNLKEGLYLLVDPNTGEYKELLVKKEAKSNKKNKENKEAVDEKLLSKFKDRDLVSNLISTNKYFYDKKIHSSVGYCVFIKCENLRDKADVKKWTFDESIKHLSENLELFKNPESKYASDKIKSEIYKESLEKHGPIDISKVDFLKEWIVENEDLLKEKVANLKNTDYLKIFLDCDLEKYKEEYSKYRELYVLTDPCEYVDENDSSKKTVLGVHSFFTNLNSKKPYLMSKTKKNEHPILVDSEEAGLLDDVVNFLNQCFSSGKKMIYIGDEIKAYKAGEEDYTELRNINSRFLLRLDLKKKKLVFEDFDTIDLNGISQDNFPIKLGPKVPVEDDFVLSKSKALENLQFKGNKTETFDRKGVINLINGLFFENMLQQNLFTSKITKPDYYISKINFDDLKHLILKYRDSIIDYLYRFKDNTFIDNIGNLIFEALSLKTAAYGGATQNLEALCVGIGLIEYFKGEYDMENNIREIDSKLNEFLSNKDKKINPQEQASYISSIPEFSYVSGQVYRYLMSLDKSKSENRNMDLLNPVIRNSFVPNLKSHLLKLFTKYNHSVRESNLKFQKLFYMINTFESEERFDVDYFLAGYLSRNLIYVSNKKSNEEDGVVNESESN